MAKKQKKKSEEATVALRVGEVLRIRLDGAQYHDVVQYAAVQTPPWDLKERQIREYIRRADNLLVERQDRNRRRVVARQLAQRQALFARAVNAADYRTALAIIDSEAKLRGLYPEKDLKELVKLAAAQGQRIEELERRNASGETQDAIPEQRSPAGQADD